MSTPESRLETARVCTDHQVRTVITCWLIERIADHLLRAAPRLFSIPYRNTPIAPMLKDHADAAVVWIFETLCGDAPCKSCLAKGAMQKGCKSTTCGKGLTEGLGLRGLDDLKNHRDVVGHPITWHLNRAKVRKFVDAKRHYADARPALVWDVHRSIVDAQIAAGVAATIIDVKVGHREAIILSSILQPCWRGPAIGETALIDLMKAAWTKDRVAFEKHPDGQFPPKTKRELHEIYEKEKAAWKRSRGDTP